MADVVELSGTLREIIDRKIVHSMPSDEIWYIRIPHNRLSHCGVMLYRESETDIDQRVVGDISLKKGSKIISTCASDLIYKGDCIYHQFLPMNIPLTFFSSEKRVKQFSLLTRFSITINEGKFGNLSQTRKLQTTSTNRSLESLSYCKHNSSSTSSSAMFQKLSEDMIKLFEDKSECDVTFKCMRDVRVVKAHKIILCARSPVFDAMFSNSFEESRSGVVEVKDVSSVAFQCLVRYLYSGVVPDLSVLLAGDLLHAAQKYQILELQRACVNFLKTSVTTKTVFYILEVASLYNENLKNFAMNYICKNIRHLKRSPIWSQLEEDNPSLVFEVMNFVINDY